jgi:hypothetical protein
MPVAAMRKGVARDFRNLLQMKTSDFLELPQDDPEGHNIIVSGGGMVKHRESMCRRYGYKHP